MSSIQFEVRKDLERTYKKIQNFSWPESKTELIDTIKHLNEYLREHDLQDLNLYKKSNLYISMADHLSPDAEAVDLDEKHLKGRELFNHIYAEIDTNLFMLLLPYSMQDMRKTG